MWMINCDDVNGDWFSYFHEVRRIHVIYFHYIFIIHACLFWFFVGVFPFWYYKENASKGWNFEFMLVATHPWLGKMGGDDIE